MAPILIIKKQVPGGSHNSRVKNSGFLLLFIQASGGLVTTYLHLNFCHWRTRFWSVGCRLQLRTNDIVPNCRIPHKRNFQTTVKEKSLPIEVGTKTAKALTLLALIVLSFFILKQKRYSNAFSFYWKGNKKYGTGIELFWPNYLQVRPVGAFVTALDNDPWRWWFESHGIQSQNFF